jgi:tRNA G18 (ribose-2'-O)-methylase SpoU
MEQENNSSLISKVTGSNNQQFDFYLLIYNIQSKHNIGTLIRSASAFNCKKIIVLGADKKVLKKFFGSQGTVKKMEFIYFKTVEEVKEFCKENNVFICGVEIGEKSVPVHKFSFRGNTLFVLGNEGAGMNKRQKEMCDDLVYISQYSNKTGSLNVAIAGSIIFHHFGIWANYKEAEFTDEKYNVEYINTQNNQIKTNEDDTISNLIIDEQNHIDGFNFESISDTVNQI